MAKFDKITKIGEGGFGEVWTCRDEAGDLFAMKRAPSSLDDDSKHRFAREVRILGDLDHPNIVKVLAKRLLSEPFYYIMPLYRHSLESELPKLVGDESRINTIVSEILDGMEYAHLQGVLHRDVKPANVLMNSDTDLVISDLGLGRIIDSASTRQTISGFGMGTIEYIAPEQYRNVKHADARSDVFSLGRLVYELYTGPLAGMHQDVSSLPAGIAHIVMRCTRPNPDDRFQSITALKNAWKSHFNAVVRLSGTNNLRALLAQLLASGRFDANQLEEFSKLLELNQGDEDLIHEVLTQLDADLVRQAWEYNKGGINIILNSYLEVVARRGWPFDHTDRVANQIQRLYVQIDDPELRAQMIVAVLELGVSHSRWHVLDVFDVLMDKSRSNAELKYLVVALTVAPLRNRQEAADRLKKSKVAPEIWTVLTS